LIGGDETGKACHSLEEGNPGAKGKGEIITKKIY